jgi:hypothetical protein
MLKLMILLLSFASIAEEKVYGEWIAKRKYDYRYVTTYKVKKVKKPLKDFPWIEEDCHDSGNRFANWSKSLSYDITYTGSVAFNLLGFLDIDLGGERSKTIEFTFQRWVTPELGIKARHILHEEFEIWEGFTQVEYRYGELIEPAETRTPFRLDNVNYGIFVKREILQRCE